MVIFDYNCNCFLLVTTYFVFFMLFFLNKYFKKVIYKNKEKNTFFWVSMFSQQVQLQGKSLLKTDKSIQCNLSSNLSYGYAPMT